MGGAGRGQSAERSARGAEEKVLTRLWGILSSHSLCFLSSLWLKEEVATPIVLRLFQAKNRPLLQAAVVSSWRRGVGMFRGQVNPVSGRLDWVVDDRDVESEDEDLSRELARSQYGDMLHDTARVGH